MQGAAGIGRVVGGRTRIREGHRSRVLLGREMLGEVRQEGVRQGSSFVFCVV